MSRIKDKLDDSTTANILVAIDATVLIKDRRSACDCINMYTVSCSAVDVVVTVGEDGLVELVEHLN